MSTNTQQKSFFLFFFEVAEKLRIFLNFQIVYLY